MIDELKCNGLLGTSTLKIEEDKLFEDERYAEDYSAHCVLVKDLAIIVEK